MNSQCPFMVCQCPRYQQNWKLKSLGCVSAAEAVLCQCGREYGFSDEPLRATDISTLTPEEREGLPTNNCISEGDLSRFDKEAVVSGCRNRKFKAKEH